MALLASVLRKRSSGICAEKPSLATALHHTVRRKIQAGEERRDRHGAVGHRAALGAAIGDVLRHFEGGSVGLRQQLIPGVAARLPADGNLKGRLGGMYKARDWQQGAKNQGGKGHAKPSTALQTAHGASLAAPFTVLYVIFGTTPSLLRPTKGVL